ncbi:hypothetical protein PHYBLDRAFT_114932, partial [Phycomyces blakesleeanus NRRL 1555(-)]
NSCAILKLGIMYETGQGVRQDDRLAFKHYERAAVGNDPVAQYILGLHYRLGSLGLKRDNQQAKRFISKSAQAGVPPAQRVLGLMYAQQLISSSDNGQANNTRRKNYRIALGWFRRAASHGGVRALGLVGFCFEHGYGVPADHRAAFSYYRKAAANKGHRTALYSLGLYYINGLEGITRNIPRARECFNQAAQKGLTCAMTALATLYRNAYMSNELPERKTESQCELAVQWYQRAALLGDATAQRELGLLHGAGLGVPKKPSCRI